MRNVLFGMIIGTAIGLAVSSHAAFISGPYPLTGWTVTDGDRQICEEPEVDYKNKEIQCPGLPVAAMVPHPKRNLI
jgi:hypothetical protein